jgi:hypothetical protein
MRFFADFLRFFELFAQSGSSRAGMNHGMNELGCGDWNFRTDTPSNLMSVNDAPRSSPWAGKTRFVIPMPGWSASVGAKASTGAFF